VKQHLESSGLPSARSIPGRQLFGKELLQDDVQGNGHNSCRHFTLPLSDDPLSDQCSSHQRLILGEIIFALKSVS
jgi:hypothetical protein